MDAPAKAGVKILTMYRRSLECAYICTRINVRVVRSSGPLMPLSCISSLDLGNVRTCGARSAVLAGTFSDTPRDVYIDSVRVVWTKDFESASDPGKIPPVPDCQRQHLVLQHVSIPSYGPITCCS